MVLTAFDVIQSSKTNRDPAAFDINSYLQRLDKVKGKCRHCQRVVPWSRARVTSHKRANCMGITDAEKTFFHAQHTLRIISPGKRARQRSSSPEPRKAICVQTTASTWVDTLTIGDRDAITTALAAFFRTGVSFRVVESDSLKALLTCLRPAYATHIPTAKTLSGALLDRHYTELREQGMTFVREANVYTLVSDGWSNCKNEHQVNYVVVVPGQKPFFLKSVSTVGIPQTSERIAAEILKVLEELGLSKCVAVITDNAPNMRGAWEIIERKCPRIFANGCAAHVMNLLIKDICNLTEFSDTLADVMSVIKFVRNHQHVLAAFQEKRRLFQITHDLVLVVPTRWYSHYNACRYLRAAKFATQALLEDDVAPILNDIQNQEAVDKFKRLTGSSGFWSRLRKLTSVLKFPSEIIGKFEKDDCNLYKVYHYFTELHASWEKRLTLGTNLMTELKAIVTARWNFLHTESMGFAYMLTPKTATLKWLLNDKINTKNELISYISAYYDGDTATECVDELNTFLTMYPTRPMKELNEYNKLTGIQYWAQYGMSEYPLLSSIAIRVFSIPTSSAAAERGWSIFSFLHTKRRNRLTMEKLEKLAFVYINHALLDKHDKTDYIKLYLQDE